MRALIVLALCVGCSEPEPAEVVTVAPTLALTGIEASGGSTYEAIYDVGNPNGFAIHVTALRLGLTSDGASDAVCVALPGGRCDGEDPGWPDDADLIADLEGPAEAITLAARETTECHAALEDCRVVDGTQFCCDNGDGCKPLGDCFGRVTPEGSRCLVCPTHAELRVRFDLADMPTTLTARAGAHFEAAELGKVLAVTPEAEVTIAR